MKAICQSKKNINPSGATISVLTNGSSTTSIAITTMTPTTITRSPFVKWPRGGRHFLRDGATEDGATKVRTRLHDAGAQW